MVLATLYIMWCTARNRMRRRLRRLREPRYLIGAIIGGLYLFFALYGRTRPRRPPPNVSASPGARQAQRVIASFTAAAPSLGGLALLVAAAVCWNSLRPKRRSCLQRQSPGDTCCSIA